jgi:hypothetical protein
MVRPVVTGPDDTQAMLKEFQTGVGKTFATRRAHAYVTLLMASGLMLATITAVVTVSIEVVKAATLH